MTPDEVITWLVAACAAGLAVGVLAQLARGK